MLTPTLAFGISEARDLGQFATNLGTAFPIAVRLMVASCYLAGIGFALASAYKFKQYKDNPTKFLWVHPLHF